MHPWDSTTERAAESYWAKSLKGLQPPRQKLKGGGMVETISFDVLGVPGEER